LQRYVTEDQRRRQVLRFREGPGDVVISACLAASPTPVRKKFSPDFFVSYGPHWEARRTGSRPLDPLASYAVAEV